MSLTTYSDLTTAIAAWLGRADLTGVIPDFIRLAEARMVRELRMFQTRSTYANPVLAATGATAVLGMTAVEILTCGWRIFDAALTGVSPVPIPQVTAEQLGQWHDDNPLTGEPQAYALVGQTLKVYPFPDVPKDSLGVDSFYILDTDIIGPSASFAVPITAANYASNPILAAHPDLYLYGALVESAPYLMHDERLPMWEARYQQAVKQVRVQDERMAYGSRDFFRTLARVF